MWGGKIMDELEVSHSGSRVENKRQCGCLPSCCRVRRYVLFYNPLDRSLKLNALSAKRTDGQWKGGRNWNSTQSSQGSISSVVRKSEFFLSIYEIKLEPWRCCVVRAIPCMCVAYLTGAGQTQCHLNASEPPSKT